MTLASYDNPWEDDGEGDGFRYPECETPGCGNRVYARADVFCLDCQQEHRRQKDELVKRYLERGVKRTA